MTQRTVAGLTAMLGVVLLWLYLLLAGVPYVTYSPGLTIDVLGDEKDRPIIEVTGHPTYDDSGQLRLTTVYVSQPAARVNLYEALAAWANPDNAVLPYDAVYRPNETNEDSRAESAVQMVSSQDAATAAALRELGFKPRPLIEVLHVGEGMPADGLLKPRDVLVEVDGKPIKSAQDVVKAVDKAPVGTELSFAVERKREYLTVKVAPKLIDGDKLIGITPGPGFEFPFDVALNINPDIGGPSAGLIFSLGIYDVLTPGSLTGFQAVAGTGTIDEDGKVGPIGGIAQKVAAARDAKAKLFLVPVGNCREVAAADPGEMRLAVVTSLHDAVQALEDWSADPQAPLQTCRQAEEAVS